MLGLEDLLLANLLARKAMAPPAEIQAALEAVDREPARGDLYGRLAARGGPLAQPDVREKALASVQRYVFAKSEAAFLARLRASGAIPLPTVDALVAEQQKAQMAWSLADRLVREGKLSPVRCQVLQKEAAGDLKVQEQQLVAKHRGTRFAETLGLTPGIVGKATSQFTAALDSSTEGLNVFSLAAGQIPPARATGVLAPQAPPQAEQTIKLPPNAVASAMRGNAAPEPGEAGERTMILPNGGINAVLSVPTPGADGHAQGEMTMKLPPGSVAAAGGTDGQAPGGPLAPGKNLAGKYQVVSELGRGGMGVVYRAAAADRNGEEIALKAVSTKKGGKDEVVQRFKREILTASLVDHPNVCAVYDAGEADSLAYMAMELIEGETLKELVAREGPLPEKRALDLIEQVLNGIQACHAAKVIHRDLKPENVRVTKDGVAKIVDFGIARLINQDTFISERVFVTVKGTLSGTPAYVAPELVMEPDLIDARCDVYAIGIIFYELLTGKLPYKSTTVRGLLRDTIEARPIPLAEAAPGKTFDERVERFLFRMMEKDTEVRYQTAEETLKALAELRAPVKPPEPEKKPGFFARLFGGLFGKKT